MVQGNPLIVVHAVGGSSGLPHPITVVLARPIASAGFEGAVARQHVVRGSGLRGCRGLRCQDVTCLKILVESISV